MTKNQIEMIKARETERANRAQEALAKRGQNLNAIGTTLRGAGSFLSSFNPAANAAMNVIDAFKGGNH